MTVDHRPASGPVVAGNHLLLGVLRAAWRRARGEEDEPLRLRGRLAVLGHLLALDLHLHEPQGVEGRHPAGRIAGSPDELRRCRGSRCLLREERRRNQQARRKGKEGSKSFIHRSSPIRTAPAGRAAVGASRLPGAGGPNCRPALPRRHRLSTPRRRPGRDRLPSASFPAVRRSGARASDAAVYPTSENRANRSRLPVVFVGWANMVGARGFEPPTTRSRTVCSTRLSYAPTR